MVNKHLGANLDTNQTWWTHWLLAWVQWESCQHLQSNVWTLLTFCVLPNASVSYPCSPIHIKVASQNWQLLVHGYAYIYIDVDEVLLNLNSYLTENQRFQFVWIPYTNWTQTLTINPTDQVTAVQAPQSPWWDNTRCKYLLKEISCVFFLCIILANHSPQQMASAAT